MHCYYPDGLSSSRIAWDTNTKNFSVSSLNRVDFEHHPALPRAYLGSWRNPCAGLYLRQVRRWERSLDLELHLRLAFERGCRASWCQLDDHVCMAAGGVLYCCMFFFFFPFFSFFFFLLLSSERGMGVGEDIANNSAL